MRSAPVIPGGDDAVERLADDGIVGRLDHCRQTVANLIRLLALA